MIAPDIREKEHVSKSSNRRLRRLVAWAVVASLFIIAIVVAICFNSPGDRIDEIESNAKAKIADRRPSTVKCPDAKTEAPVPAQVPVEKVSAVAPATQEAKPKSNSPWANKPPRVIKHREADKKPRRFVYDSEELIANLLEIEPGTLMFGELPYGRRFNDDFKQAIMQKVKINPEDDEYTKELKRQVQAVKDDFKQIMLNGGDVGEEMRKARNELKELGIYKETLKRELFALRKSGEYSSDDMKDFITAANKMLEDKGLSPLNVPAVFLRNLELKERKAK